MKKSVILATFVALLLTQASFAGEPAKITHGKITGRSVAAGVVSFVVWPGLGQAINGAPAQKVATHAILGIFQIPRFWSCYDAVVDRKGGYLEGKI